ncbi:MAG: 23S rRNA (pseudouridine(1915)-N(3))-methyltransferase RlmH [Deltaproteobacteria bacterium]|nr:23S rRNA (pseudouridine(1915)-N(3))-methyltransferase RlmH [Deltaproteobacteria bacterium]
MRLTLLAVGKSAASWSEAGVREYAKRLKRQGGLSETWVKAEPFRGDVDAVKRAEGERLLKAVRERDLLVALDERGDAPDTPTFAAMLQEAQLSGASGLVFAIGGPYGLSDEVRQRAWRTVRLSSLVLNHDLARVVLVEQLYRSFDLLEGGPYHH